MDLEAARVTCAYCPKLCRHVCPAAEAERTEESTPTFKQQVALEAAQGRRPLDPERARVLFKCTDCRASEPACRHRVPLADSLRDARRQAVAAGAAPEEVGWLAERFRERGSPYALDLAARAEEAAPGARAERGALGLFPACTSLAHEPDELPAELAALEAAGLAPAVALPSPACCGYPLDTLGLEAEFRDHAARVVRSLERFEQLVVPGPACAWTLSVRYRELGLTPRFEVTPLVDLLAAHAPVWAGRRLPDGDETPRHAYHDPCFLGRWLDRYEEPRAVLRAATGREPVELSPNRAEALCSGGGGGYPLTHPGPARSCANTVLEAFRASGADVLVSACPQSRRQLRAADPEARVESLSNVLVARNAREPRA